MEIEEHHTEVEVSMDKIIEEDHVTLIITEITIGETILQICKIMQFKISEVDTEAIYRNDNFGRGNSRSRDRQYSDNIRRNKRGSSRSQSGSRTSTNRDRIRCYMCRKYDHFTKNCPTSQVEKESEQIQQMYNIDEEQTALKVLVIYIYMIA